jgi:FkbM family methyltransferase
MNVDSYLNQMGRIATTKRFWRAYMAVVRFGRRTGLANIRLGKSTVGYLVDRKVRRLVKMLVRSRRDSQGGLTSEGEPSLAVVEMILGEFEPMTSALIQSRLKRGMIVVDAGAHIGYYTLPCSVAVGKHGHVYSFEPHPANFASLIANIAAAGCDNVSAFPYAVADVEGETLLYPDPTDSATHSMYPRTPESRPFRVKAVALAPFLERLGITHIDVVKMDIEGAEPNAVEGMRPLIDAGKAVMLVVEFAPENLRRGGREPSEFLRQLKILGLQVYMIDDVAKIIAPLPVGLQEKLGHRQVNLLCINPRGVLESDSFMVAGRDLTLALRSGEIQV